MLLFIPFILLFIIISFIHNAIIANTLDEKLKKLHASGIFIEMLKEEKHVFKNKKDFIIRLDKVELIAELLFGLRTNDPLLVQLSKLQGLKLNVKLSHTKFIFSNELVMYLSINTLPGYFSNQSQLFSDLVNFSNSNPELIQTRINVWDNSFSFNIPSLTHTFAAEHNLSYDVNLEELSLFGYIKNHSDFDINSQCEKLHITLLDHEEKRSELFVAQSSINLHHIDKTLGNTISFAELKLDFIGDQNSTLMMKELHASQNFDEEKKSYFNSILSLELLKLSEKEEILSLSNLAYDLALDNLDYTTITHIRELIHTSNTNTVVFIFDDISKDIATLIRHKAVMTLNNLSFDDISFKDKHYKDAKLSFHAKSQPYNKRVPIDFELNMHLSRALYREFLDQVPNASLTQNFITEHNSTADFHMKLTKEGLMLNNKNLQVKPKQENNTTDQNLTTSATGI